MQITSKLFRHVKINIQIQRFFAKESKMRYLCVAEKNDAAKNIAAILSQGSAQRREGLSIYNKIYKFTYRIKGVNSDCVMTSVSGHLLNLAFSANYRGWSSCNPVELFDAPVNKVCPEESQKIRNTLIREVKYCAGLIIWTDCDREGENIGYEIIKVCQAEKPDIKIYRAKFSEITARSIIRAINNLESPNKKVSDAVDVRSELDLRTGAAFTRLQTLRLKHVFPDVLDHKLISYGSCQFPTLGFVVERFTAIENFIPELFWQINLSHTIKELTTVFTWNRNRLFEKSAVQAFLDICLQTKQVRIVSVDNKPKSKWRPVPLDTIEMEKIISRKMRLSAKDTMKIAEKLYTSGFISYPRTETNIFPKEMNLTAIVEQQAESAEWGNFATRIMNEGGPTPRQGKKSDQAHPPIHPTKFTSSLSGNEKRVYEYIVRHFLACVHKDAKGHETIVQADCNGEKFTAKGLVILEKNYLDVYTYETWNGKEIHDYQVGDTFEPTILEMWEGETSPPKLLTEADLIALMEKHGIGTDATHAEHIETIKSREYVTLQQNIYFVPAALGMGLVEGYNNMELQISLAKPNLRSDFENDLKLICEGRKQPNEVLRDQIARYREVFEIVAQKMDTIDGTLGQRLNRQPRPFNDEQMTRPANKPVVKCPKCGSNMFIRQRSNNAGWYLGCSNFPECKNAAWFTGVSSAQVTDDTCETCGPNVRKVKFTFRQNPFPGEPNPNVLCIAGCDAAVLLALDIRASAVKGNPTQRPDLQGGNQNGGFDDNDGDDRGGGGGGGGGWGGSGSNNQPKPPRPRQPSNHSRSSSSSTTWSNVASTNRANTSRTSSNNHPTRSSFSNTPSIGDDRPPNTQVCNCQQEAVLLMCRNGANAGRQFYKCKSNSAQGGGCRYFVWKDDEQTPQTSSSNGGNNNQNVSNAHTNQTYQNGNGADADTMCKCGLPTVTRTVNKEGSNKGRQFRACSKPMGQSCDFFEWTDENSKPKTFAKRRGKRKCGVCHQEGHTRVKCPKLNQS